LEASSIGFTGTVRPKQTKKKPMKHLALQELGPRGPVDIERKEQKTFL